MNTFMHAYMQYTTRCRKTISVWVYFRSTQEYVCTRQISCTLSIHVACFKQAAKRCLAQVSSCPAVGLQSRGATHTPEMIYIYIYIYMYHIYIYIYMVEAASTASFSET